MKKIEGYPNYLINENGDVFSIPRTDFRNRKHGGIFLKRKTDPRGYQGYALVANGKTKSIRIHRLVAKHFLRPFVEGLEVNHKDGDKTNNHVSNLELCTTRANINHRESVVQKKTRWGVIKTNSKRGTFWAAKIRMNGKQVCLARSRIGPEEFLFEKYREAYKSLHGSYPY